MTGSTLDGSADHTEYVYDHTNQRVKKHTIIYEAPPGGDPCDPSHEECPVPEQQSIVVPLEPVVTKPEPKLLTPVDGSLDDQLGVNSMENGVGVDETVDSLSSDVTIQTVDNSLTSLPRLVVLDKAADSLLLAPSVATSTDPVITDPIIEPLPVVIEPIATSTPETATSTPDRIQAPIEPESMPAAQDAATYYIDKYYETQFNGSSKNHYFLGNIKLATDNLSGSPIGIFYVLGDHLGSSSLITDSSGTITEVSDYYPYGSEAFTNVTTDIGNNYKFTGKELDNETNLQYFGARYYDNSIGRFASIDPFMLQIASDQRVQEKTGSKLKQLLSDPQALNSYAYSRNNPVIIVDPDGHWWKEIFTGRQSFNDFQVELGQAAQQMYDTSGVWKNAMDHPVATGVVVGVASGAVAYGAAAGLTYLSIEFLGGAGTGCLGFCGSAAADAKNVIDYTQQYGSALGQKMNQVAQNLRSSDYNFSTHSVARIAQKIGIGNESKVINVLNNIKPFEYIHEGIVKLGYYDATTKIFIGQEKATGNVITVITDVTSKYINSLTK
ncbi:MAG: RHS repeat-associated core domain-containing protein [Candidatus Komeilibacteria bacterium]